MLSVETWLITHSGLRFLSTILSVHCIFLLLFTAWVGIRQWFIAQVGWDFLVSWLYSLAFVYCLSRRWVMIYCPSGLRFLVQFCFLIVFSSCLLPEWALFSIYGINMHGYGCVGLIMWYSVLCLMTTPRLTATKTTTLKLRVLVLVMVLVNQNYN